MQTWCLANSYKANDTGCYIETHQRNGSRSRGKRQKLINYPANSIIKAPNVFLTKKRFNNGHASNVKKMSFKSFDQRRAMTKLDHRDASIDDPVSYSYSNPLRSSSACHKKSKSSKAGNSTHRKIIVKASSQRNKKMKQSHQMNPMNRISATQAMLKLVKTWKNK